MARLDDFELVVFDCEVFAHDWLFVFKSHASGEAVAFWNDAEAVAEFMEAHEDSVFVGFNSKRYDAWILRAVLAGLEPEEVKEINDHIVGSDEPVWEHPYLRGFYYELNNCDLMDDMMLGTSLKSIEGHLGMSIEESTVDFDYPDALDDVQREEVERYCRYDVDATEHLLEIRIDYLETKLHLAELGEIDPVKALGMTDPKLAAEFMRASAVDFDDEREYEFPGRLDYSFVPDELIEFFGQMRDPSIPDDELFKKKLTLDIGGCPVTYGFGGLHGALDRFKARADAGTMVLCEDVSSLYPSLMIEYGYVSRSVPSPEVFSDIRAERFAAKKRGDKQTANALKSPLNKAYGAMLNKYNPMFDPKMGRSVCVSGQLSLTVLAVAYSRIEGLKLFNINTDGIMFTVPADKYGEVGRVNEWWQAMTALELEEDKIDFIWQKDVSNYAMRKEDGAEKLKGAYLVRGISPIGAWSINNNATVVADALRSYLLDGTPVADTINACDDPSKFQLIAKAGHKYSEVYQLMNDAPKPGHCSQVPRQKCNRVFASTDDTLGRLYKVKAADGRVAKVESLPEHCLICNDGYPPIGEIDKQWYIALAEKRAQDFEREEKMAEEAKETAPKATAKRSTAKKAAANDNSKPNIFQKLAMARRMFLDAGVKKSGMNHHLEFEYWTLDDITPAQTRVFEEVGLLEHFTFVKGKDRLVSRRQVDGEEVYEPADSYAVATVYNADSPEERLEFRIRWVDLPMQKNRDGKPISNPVQDLGKVQTYLRRYLKMQVLDLSEPDEIDAGAGEPEKEKAPSASNDGQKATVKTASKKPATASQRKKAAEKVTASDGDASKLQVNQLKKVIRKMMDAYGEGRPEVGAYVTELGAETDNLKEITKARCEQAIRDLGEMKERIETEGAED